MGTLTPDLLKGLMSAYGFENTLALANKADVSHAILYKFLSGKRGLGLGTRRKLAAVFPGSAHLFVADIVSAHGEPREDVAS